MCHLLVTRTRSREEVRLVLSREVPPLTTEQHSASPIQFSLAVSLAPSDVCFRPVRLMPEKITIDTMRPGQSGSF